MAGTILKAIVPPYDRPIRSPRNAFQQLILRVCPIETCHRRKRTINSTGARWLRPAQPTSRGSKCRVVHEWRLWGTAVQHLNAPRTAAQGRSCASWVGRPTASSAAIRSLASAVANDSFGRKVRAARRGFFGLLFGWRQEKDRFTFLLTGRHRYRSVQVAHQRMKSSAIGGNMYGAELVRPCTPDGPPRRPRRAQPAFRASSSNRSLHSPLHQFGVGHDFHQCRSVDGQCRG